jgi:dipeptidyl aminopeptidase/acylaminoacyl peptidase
VTSIRRRAALVAAVGVLAAAGCTSQTPGDQAGAPRPTPALDSADATTSRSTTTPKPTTASPTPTPKPPYPVSIPALMHERYDGRGLRLGDVLDENGDYTRYFVTYRSGDLRISGIMNVPKGDGPFPALVLNHGYIDPDVYTNGRGLRREQDYLARHGYVVLHTDYRNHAQSDDDPDAELNLRLGYTEDVVNAVLALRTSGMPSIDPDRIGLLGRSMGGGVTYNVLVAQPGLVDAAVVYAPVSADVVDNFNRWIRGDPGDDGLADEIIAAYGSPEDNPAFWRNVSPVTFFDRVSEPILVHHGTADESCPIEWSRSTVRTLRSLGKDAELLTYKGEPHAFEAAWERSMERTVDFFEQHL